MKLNEGITFAILIWNLLVFMIYGIDKSKARKGAWRIPEKYLLSFAFFCGGFGAWLAGITFHHKTRKWYFWLAWICGIIVEIGILYYIWRS